MQRRDKSLITSRKKLVALIILQPFERRIEYNGKAMSEDQEITGDLVEQWVLDVISNVRNGHPSTDSNVLTTLEELLQSKLSDRELTPANLKEVATTLVDSFVLKTTEPEVNDED